MPWAEARRSTPVIDRLVDAGISADRCCRVLGVARQRHYKVKRIPTTPTQLRRQWLTGPIRELHVASRGTYGYRRVHADPTMVMGITVCGRFPRRQAPGWRASTVIASTLELERQG